jgi:hypothetical protein
MGWDLSQILSAMNNWLKASWNESCMVECGRRTESAVRVMLQQRCIIVTVHKLECLKEQACSAYANLCGFALCILYLVGSESRFYRTSLVLQLEYHVVPQVRSLHRIKCCICLSVCVQALGPCWGSSTASHFRFRPGHASCLLLDTISQPVVRTDLYSYVFHASSVLIGVVPDLSFFFFSDR